MFLFFLLIVQTVIPIHFYQNEGSPSILIKNPKSEKPAFQTGEKLKYLLHYGILNAGIAELSINESKQNFKGDKEVINMVGRGWTTGATNWFFKVDDYYETYLDMEEMQSLRFIRRVNEGGYTINQDYYFSPDSNSVRTQDDKDYMVPSGVQDMLSSFYYARSIDYSKAKINDIFIIPVFLDDKVEYLRIIYKGKETIKTKSGRYRCLKFNPMVIEGRVFESNEDLSVWISDDDNKIPILIKSKIAVGSIKAELTEYKGLAHPFSKIK